MYLFEDYKVLDYAKVVHVHGDPIVLGTHVLKPSYIKFLLMKLGLVPTGSIEGFYYQLAKKYNKKLKDFDQYAIFGDLATCFVEQNGNVIDLYVDTEKARNAYLSLREELDPVATLS